MRPALLAMVLVTIGAACGDGGGPGPAVDGATCDDVDLAALRAWGDAGFAGSIVVSDHGQVTCSAATGLADEAARRANAPDTVYAIGSVSKAMTAVAVLGLIDDGDLRLDDHAGDLVSDLTGPAADATVEQLLLHTSGLAGSAGPDHVALASDDAVAAIGALEVLSTPGEAFEYTNAGYTLLALIVESVTGVDYRTHLVDEVLRDGSGASVGGFWDGRPSPPGPRAIGYLDDGSTGASGDFDGPHWALSGNGDVAMSMIDLVRWAEAEFSGALADGLPELLSVVSFDRGDGSAVVPGWVRFDDAVYGETVFGAAGGGGDVGHEVTVVVVPGTGRVAAIASNHQDVTAEELLGAWLPSLVAGDPLPPPATSGGTVDAAAMEPFVGEYTLGSDGSFLVATDDRGLIVRPTGADALVALHPRPTGDDLDAVVAHESDVVALLAGSTDAGVDELQAIEGDLGGTIEDVEVLGTVRDDGELRTYVVLVVGDDATTAWYALDGAGAVQGVELDVELPPLVVAPVGSTIFEPVDPVGDAPDVTITFDGPTLTIDGGPEPVVATRG